jgi:hypothetical protein
VTINVVNSAPVADDESYSVHAGQTLSIAAPGILDGDTDADGDPLSVSVVNITGLQGTLNPAANGGFDFTPTAGFVGTTSFTYTVVDGVGGSDTGTVTVDVTAAHTIARLGDAPARLTSSDPNAWINAWTESGVSISHKAVYSNAGEAWSAVTLNGLGSTTLPGGDLFAGDLGVSGQTLATSTTRQEIDGTEALRFNLTQEATKVTVDLSRFYLDDDANVFNYNEAGRLQAFDDQGNVVGEALFHADQSAGGHLVTLEVANGFTSVVLTAGAYDLNHDFVFGAYADDAGGFATAPYGTHGSDFLVNAIEFELPVIGVNPDPG